jgi:hypothetical protein
MVIKIIKSIRCHQPVISKEHGNDTVWSWLVTSFVMVFVSCLILSHWNATAGLIFEPALTLKTIAKLLRDSRFLAWVDLTRTLSGLVVILSVYLW